MFTRLRTAFYSAVGGLEESGISSASLPGVDATGDPRLPLKYPYTRPDFLQLLTEEEVQVSGDHSMRPIIVPRDGSRLPWSTGYAEAVNAGKSPRNEDQAAVRYGTLTRRMDNNHRKTDKSPDTDQPDPMRTLPYYYFALFDGHAGTGAAVYAARELHDAIIEKLYNVIDRLIPLEEDSEDGLQTPESLKNSILFPEREVSTESLVIGALESAFWDIDQKLGEEKTVFRVTGGCTVLVALFIQGKLYVSNAGDSRGVLCRNRRAFPMSKDFTPESERQRVRLLAVQRPEFLGGEYTHLDYCRRTARKDLGKRILYREAYMTGWAYKIATPEDLKFPVVYGEGKRSRVLATIGVTRGFGDHDLKAQYSGVPVKPFLTPQPEVLVLDLERESITDNDVLVMGTDGLWDITSNEKAADIVQRSLEHFPASDDKKHMYRYTSAAQDLVMHSRGKFRERGWRTQEEKTATIDDISVFVIPLLPYKEEWRNWKQTRDTIKSSRSSSATSNGVLPDEGGTSPEAFPTGELHIEPPPDPSPVPPTDAETIPSPPPPPSSSSLPLQEAETTATSQDTAQVAPEKPDDETQAER